jgi:hypothetical protein
VLHNSPALAVATIAGNQPATVQEDKPTKPRYKKIFKNGRKVRCDAAMILPKGLTI